MTDKDRSAPDNNQYARGLHESESPFERDFVHSLASVVFESNPLPSLVLDETGAIVLINQAAREWLKQELATSANTQPGLALQCINALRSEDRCGRGEDCRDCELRKAINSVLAGSGVVKRKHATIHTEAEGKEGLLYLSVSAVELALGEDRYVLVTLEDITSRHQAEVKARKNEADLVRAQAVAGLGSWHLDIPSDKLTWSNQTYRMFELPLGTPMTAEKFMEFVHPDDRDLVDEVWKQALRGGAYEVEHRIIINGKLLWVREHAEIDFDVTGQAVYATGTVQNISALRAANEVARRKEENFSSLFHTINDFLFVIDANGNMLHVNPVVEKRLGYAIVELVGKPVLMVHPEQYHDEARRIIGEMVRGERDTCPIPLITKDGELIRVETRVSTGLWNGEPAVIGVSRDITERHKVEEALRESESRFANFSNSVADVLYRYDPIQQIYDFISPSFEHQTGYSVAELEANPRHLIDSITHPEDSPRVFAEVDAHIRKGPNAGPMVSEYRIIHKKGHVVWVRETKVIEFDDHGALRRINGVVTDITERKGVEAALGRRDAILGAVSFAARQFLKKGDWESEIGDFLEQLGKASEVGRTYVFSNSYREDGAILTTQLYEWCDVGVHPEKDNPVLERFPYYEAGMGRLADALTAGETWQLTADQFLECEKEVLEAQQVKSVLCVPIYVQDHLWGFIGFDDVIRKRVWGSVEIEATKAAAHIIAAAIQHSASRKALHDSEERFRSLASNNPDQVTIYRSDGMILYAHSPEDSHPEMSLGEHVGQFVFDCLEPVRAAQTRDRVREALESGQMQNTRYTLQEEAGPRYYEERFIPLSSDQVMSIMRDTTDLHKTELKLLKIQKLESVGVLAGGIAHDFNNILTGVLGNVSLAMSGMDPNDERIELLKECENAVMRAKGLTHQLLTFSKGGKPIRRTTAISNLVMETVAFSLRGSNVKPVYDIQANLPTVEIDADQISQAIQNLVTNADQAMPDGGSLFIKINKQKFDSNIGLAVAPGDYVRMSFRDQGTGIVEEHLNRVFDPYFTTKQTGSGLGLASCYSIVRSHGGAIDVKSKVGEGTEFIILLPASNSAPVVGDDLQYEDIKGQGRILIMDDEKTIRALGQKILRRVGYEVDVAADGNATVIMYKQALKEKRPYTVVVLDLTVPGGVGGEEAMKQLLAIDPEVIGIVCSGYSEHPLMTEHEKYGFKRCITKPFRARDLINAVAQVQSPQVSK